MRQVCIMCSIPYTYVGSLPSLCYFLFCVKYAPILICKLQMDVKITIVCLKYHLRWCQNCLVSYLIQSYYSKCVSAVNTYGSRQQKWRPFWRLDFQMRLLETKCLNSNQCFIEVDNTPAEQAPRRYLNHCWFVSLGLSELNTGTACVWLKCSKCLTWTFYFTSNNIFLWCPISYQLHAHLQFKLKCEGSNISMGAYCKLPILRPSIERRKSICCLTWYAMHSLNATHLSYSAAEKKKQIPKYYMLPNPPAMLNWFQMMNNISKCLVLTQEVELRFGRNGKTPPSSRTLFAKPVKVNWQFIDQ